MLNVLEINNTRHKHYELARRAHYNTSFSPDKRAESFCAGFADDKIVTCTSVELVEEV